MATANIFEMTLSTAVKNATQQRYATAQAATVAYAEFYGYVFYTGNTMEVSEDNGWSLLTNDTDDSEESYWTSIDAEKFDAELYWDNLITAYQGYAY